ncbi:MAG: DNA topoisomerase IV subunit B [Anaerolineae bacterium]|nr:DNA topoisomerase IV subunit B [Anaerolineae bacterium]
MYIGGTGLAALHHLAHELIDNSVDEVLAGACTHIEVEIHRDGSLTVTDDGRGIPTGMHAEKKRPTLELVFTELHAGGKFKEGSYSTSGGLHGVGVKATNALSEWLEVRVQRNGVVYYQRHEDGLPVTPVQILDPATEEVVAQVGKRGEAKAIKAHADKNLGTGSTITFKPSPRFLDTTDFDFDALARRLQVIAFLLPGVTIEFTDGRKKKKRQKRFRYDGGLVEYVRWLNEGRKPIHRSPIEVGGEQNGVAVEVVLQWHTSVDDSEIVSFVNTIPTPDGGKHVAGFKSAITKAINQFASEKKLTKGKGAASIRGSDTLAGLTGVLKLSMHDPHFTSQTKTQLASDNAQGIVHSIVYEGLLEALRKKISLGRTIVQQAQAAAQARVAASKARSLVIRRSVLDAVDSGLPGKLADVSRGTPTEQTVLYIVEGDSAGGCFLGDTLIRLASGETKTIRELAEDWERGIQHFGYASNGDGDVRIVPLNHPRLTRRDAELIEVELDNGERVRCTPDHLFRMRDRSYQRADQLQAGDSLMALKIRLTEKGANFNVKAVAVRPLDERGDVYDITVDGYHNFALAAGSFVHNSAKQARDRRYHAILPLRGKPLNVEGVKLTRLLSNNEIKAIIAAIGGGVGADFSVEDMRYGGVGILVDADVDGDHIRTLLYTLFWRYMRPMVEAGRLYVAVAPLYLLRKGKQARYAYSDRERDAILEKWGQDRVTIQRYKGLGEMNPEQLRETVFQVGDNGPFNDNLRRVMVEDVHHANQIISTLMGKSAQNRRAWLLERWREEESGENGGGEEEVT